MTLPMVEASLLVLVLVTGLLTALLRDTLAAIIVFAGYSIGMSIIWLVFQAPDVGLTEAAVGAGVMTVLFLVTIAKTTRLTGLDGAIVDVNWTTATLVAVFVAAVLSTIPAFPAVGDAEAVTFQHVAPYYLENAYEEAGVQNAVTAVLAAYRGFDTLGEATVVFAAGVAVLAVLRQEVAG